MIRKIAVCACFLSSAALAQSVPHRDSTVRPHVLTHEQMMHTGHIPAQPGDATPTEPGQGAFAAIQEIVGILEADPKTDWSKVDIAALRQHLVDMNNVTLSADVKNAPIDGGMRFIVTGTGAVSDSIRRMVAAHAATMNGVDGWKFEAANIEAGATLTVRPSSRDMAKLQGLGFIGVMTRGMHHQEHHLMIARGENPHH